MFTDTTQHSDRTSRASRRPPLLLLLFAVAATLASACTSSSSGGAEQGAASDASDPASSVSATPPSAAGAALDPAVVALALDAGVGDPRDVTFPEPQDAAAAVGYLGGDGAAAVVLVTATEPLWSAGAEACADVSDSLDAAGSPDALRAVAAATPDEVTGEVLIGLHGTVTDVLSACADPAAVEPEIRDFAWQWSVAARRLDDLGVPR